MSDCDDLTQGEGKSSDLPVSRSETGTFEAECRREFTVYCECYKAAPYHSMKRKYVEKAYAVIDAYLDWLSVQTL